MRLYMPKASISPQTAAHPQSTLQPKLVADRHKSGINIIDVSMVSRATVVCVTQKRSPLSSYVEYTLHLEAGIDK